MADLIPPMPQAWADGDLFDADTLNARITELIRWLMGLSGVNGFDLTPLGRDNGRGRFVLPEQAATGRPLALDFTRTAGEDTEGALVLFNDEGHLGVGTADGSYRLGTVDGLVELSTTPAGTLYYISDEPAPGRPNLRRIKRLDPPTAADDFYLTWDAATQEFSWGVSFTPSGLVAAYEYSTGTAGTADVIYPRSESPGEATFTGTFDAGVTVATLPFLPWGGSIGMKVTATSTTGSVLDFRARGASLQTFTSTKASDEQTLILDVLSGDRITVLVQSGQFTSIALEISVNFEFAAASLV